MPQSFASLNYHIVFSTKGREPWIEREMQSRLYEYIGGTVRGLNGVLLAAGGMSDHVHLLASLSRTRAIADDVRDIKANASSWIHNEFPKLKHFAWQTGYSAFTVSYSGIPDVKEYLASQEEHHRKRTFKDELVMYLKRHEIEYDERYIWD